MSAETMLSLLETDAKNTGADPEVKIETKETTEPKVEAQITEKVEKTESQVSEPKVDSEPWYKQFEFEDEEKAKEFIISNKNRKEEKPKFASTVAEQYNTFVANGGPDDFGVFQTISKFQVSENPTTDEMIKAIVLKQTLEDPDYKGKEHLLEKKLKREFKLDMDLDLAEDDEKEEAEMRMIDLKKEFKKTAGYFSELQKKSEVKVDESLQKRLQEGPTALKSYLDNSLADLKLDIKELVKGEKGEEKFGENSIYSVIFDADMLKTKREIYESIARDKGYPDFSEGIHKEIDQVSSALALASKFEHIANNLFKAGREFERNASVEKEIKDTNPSVLGTHSKSSVGTESDDKSGEIFPRR